MPFLPCVYEILELQFNEIPQKLVCFRTYRLLPPDGRFFGFLPGEVSYHLPLNALEFFCARPLRSFPRPWCNLVLVFLKFCRLCLKFCLFTYHPSPPAHVLDP